MEEIPATKPAQRNDLALKLLGPLPPSLSLPPFILILLRWSKVQGCAKVYHSSPTALPQAAAPTPTVHASDDMPRIVALSKAEVSAPSVRASDRRTEREATRRGQYTDRPRTVDRPPALRPSVCGDITTVKQGSACDMQ